jgi:hypothetical protein
VIKSRRETFKASTVIVSPLNNVVTFRNAQRCLQCAAYEARGGSNIPRQMMRAFCSHKPTAKVIRERHSKNSRHDKSIPIIFLSLWPLPLKALATLTFKVTGINYNCSETVASKEVLESYKSQPFLNASLVLQQSVPTGAETVDSAFTCVHSSWNGCLFCVWY